MLVIFFAEENMHKLILLALFVALTGCSATDSDSGSLSPQGDEIIISYRTVTDDAGGCRPTYKAYTARDSDGLPKAN